MRDFWYYNQHRFCCLILQYGIQPHPPLKEVKLDTSHRNIGSRQDMVLEFPAHTELNWYRVNLMTGFVILAFFSAFERVENGYHKYNLPSNIHLFVLTWNVVLQDHLVVPDLVYIVFTVLVQLHWIQFGFIGLTHLPPTDYWPMSVLKC